MVFKKGHKPWNSVKGRIPWNKKAWRPFEEAREFAHSLNLKGSTEWKQYCKFGKDGIPRPNDIPSIPHLIYKNDGWKGYPDWLGYEDLV